jgi:hypothetical protein
VRPAGGARQSRLDDFCPVRPLACGFEERAAVVGTVDFRVWATDCHANGRSLVGRAG